MKFVYKSRICYIAAYFDMFHIVNVCANFNSIHMSLIASISSLDDINLQLGEARKCLKIVLAIKVDKKNNCI